MTIEGLRMAGKNLALPILGIPLNVIVLLLSCLFILGSGTAFSSDSLPAPSGEVMLKIRGALSKPNVGDEVQLDRALLESLPSIQYSTHTPWAEGLQSFTGVRLSVLLDHVGSTSTSFKAIGLDDYKFTVTDIDWGKYPVMVAYRHNGESISVRKLGPLRIMFPFDEYPELLTHKNESSAVWQLLEIDLL